MLKVTVKNEEVVDDRWEPGMIRMSGDGKVVIMIIYNGSKGLMAVKFKDDEGGGINRIDLSNKEYWLERCPIVVENAELIIGGGNND